MPARYLAAALALLLAGRAGATQVHSVSFEGRTRTHEAVLLRELGLAPGDAFSQADWQEGLRRLRNLPMLYRADGEAEESAQGVNLRVRVRERWTLIPIFKSQGTAGMQTLTLGLYDVNVLGRYKEVGFQVESHGGENLDRGSDLSLVAWLKEPRLGGSRVGLDHELWNIQRNHLLYGESEAPSAGFTRERLQLVQRWRWEQASRLAWTATGTWTRDRVDDSRLSAEVRERAAGLAPTLYHEADWGSAALAATLGQVNRDGFLYRGQDLNLEIERGWEGSRVFHQTGVQGRAFVTGGDSVNLALRASLRASDDGRLDRLPVLGGLENLRGLKVERFRAPWVLHLNAEFRIFLLRLKWLHLQQALFYDTGQAEASLAAALDSERPWAQSAGTGIRFLIPGFYRLNARFDAAWSFGRAPGRGISFGLQQFF